MRLSKKERRYRMKIIQENQYNKGEQRILDEAASEMPRSYQDIYEAQRGGAVYWFMAIIGSMRLTKALSNTGNSIGEMTEAIGEFGRTAREMCGAEEN